MTEQEKEKTINALQAQVNAAVSYLVLLRDIAEKNGSLHLYPVFEDPTVHNLLGYYRQIQAIRSY